jgi:hypothetical protein
VGRKCAWAPPKTISAWTRCSITLRENAARIFAFRPDLFHQLQRPPGLARAIEDLRRSPPQSRHPPTRRAVGMRAAKPQEPPQYQWLTLACSNVSGNPLESKDGGRCRIRTYDFHRVKVTLYR